MKRCLMLVLVLAGCDIEHVIPKECRDYCSPYTVESYASLREDFFTGHTWCRCSKDERVVKKSNDQ